MKKFCLVIIILSFGFAVQAQMSDAEKTTALQLVSRNKSAIGLSDDDLQNGVISSTYVTSSGIRMVYLQQSFKGVPVYNQLQVLAFKGDKLVSSAGGRITNIAQKVNVQNATPSISAAEAVRASLVDRKLATAQTIYQLGEKNDRLTFGKLGVSFEDITAELVWMPQGKQVKLTWQIFIAPVTTQDMWLIRVDAQTNIVIEKTSLTVQEQWARSNAAAVKKNYEQHHLILKRKENFNGAYRPAIINTGTYRVVPYPAESPIHPGGTPALITNPWSAAPGNATSLKWQNDGVTDYNTSRGNNVYAQEDRDANNNTFGQTANATSSPDPLIFDYTPDFTLAPTTATNQQFALTNLFYWNNIMHDIIYLYGFDEVSGNFQNDNQGRGGAGNDYVIADGQDAGGLNNANFSTPPDGSRPRMQMYLFNYTSPQRDGDLDDGVITHEFTHGISNRLTGGPSNTSCLTNAEQGGEGWSDYVAMMVTTDWGTATTADGALAHPIGNYVLGLPVTGAGIRTYPYSTNMAIDPWTYAMLPSTGGEPHNVGEIWCTVLWEMTWEMIQLDGINPNLYNPAATGGNSAALKLVVEGMRLQPCSPGFLDARDAILRADTLFFASRYSCAIWRAFAKRGMGRYAQQGSSNSISDQLADYSPDATNLILTQGSVSVPETQNIVYNNRVTAGACIPIANYYITDTLPTTVTYVSGGTYTAASRSVSFSPVTLSPGQTQNYSFTVAINAGTWFAPVDHVNDVVAGTTIPATWTATANTTTPNVWAVSTSQSHSAPNSYFATDPTNVATEQILTTTSAYTLSSGASSYPTLSFWHRYNSEDGWDGGVVEISINGGTTWADLGSKMVLNGYNSSLGIGSTLANRPAFTGNSNTFIQTKINLSAFAGLSVKFRFRFASDDNTAPVGGGWFVDDIILRSEPAVQMRSNLFSNTGARQTFVDTVTLITNSCVAATISAQPTNTSACVGNSASFTVNTTGSGLTYQWQVNTGSGFANITNGAPYSGATTATLNIAGVTAGMDGYQYRLVINGSCTPGSVNSNAGTLSINTAPAIVANPNDVTACATGTAAFTVNVSGSALNYQWQVNQGSGFNNVPNSTPYSGANAATLTINPLTAAMNNYQYRCVVTSTGCTSPATSTAGSLIITTAPSITTQPIGTSVCPNSGYTFIAAASGSGISYQWQLSTNNGTSFNNIPGANSANYAISGITVSMNGYQYRCVVTGACAPNATTNAATLTVYSPALIITQPTSRTVCSSSNTSFTVGATGTGVAYQWQLSTDNGATYNNVTGATSATLNLNAVTVAQSGNRYQAVITGTCGTITSASVSLTVNPLPVFTTTVPSLLCVSDTSTLLHATLAGGTWTGTGVQLDHFNPVVSGVGSFQVTYTFTNGFGCTNTVTSPVAVNECPERHRSLNSNDAAIIYPNPNSGNFNIRLNSDLYNKLGLKVYTENGTYVYSNVYTGLRFASLIPVNLAKLQSGIYFLYLYNDANNQNVHKTFRIVIAH
jgi:extracellular elastinolytic metalloproteinase